MLDLDKQALVQKPCRCSAEILPVSWEGEYGSTSTVESSLEELMDVIWTQPIRKCVVSSTGIERPGNHELLRVTQLKVPDYEKL